MSADAENPEEPAKAAGEEPAKASIGRLLIPTPFVVGIATAMSYAADLDSFPVEWGAVWTVAVVSFVIQWIAFIPAAIYDTEHCKSCASENLALPRRAMPHRTVLACRAVPCWHAAPCHPVPARPSLPRPVLRPGRSK